MQEVAEREGIRGGNAVDDDIMVDNTGVRRVKPGCPDADNILEVNVLCKHRATEVAHVVADVPARSQYKCSTTQRTFKTRLTGSAT